MMDGTNKARIVLSEKSSINILEDDNTMPFVDDFCITPSQLMEKDIGV